MLVLWVVLGNNMVKKRSKEVKSRTSTYGTVGRGSRNVELSKRVEKGVGRKTSLHFLFYGVFCFIIWNWSKNMEYRTIT